MKTRLPRPATLELISLILAAWAVMAAGLAVLPAILGNLLDEPWPVVLAWAIVSLAWLPVEVILRARTGPFARFAINLPLWVAAAFCGFWLRHTLGLP
ncbi:MAG: hypothetical protein M3Q55_07980 [Acidobacteriota bacterium]|nr:hypothetical protein [Acidobacteriota bacterium]